MKTNTIQLAIATIAASGAALYAVASIHVVVSYVAVAILVAVAAVDYRQGPKSYLAR